MKFFIMLATVFFVILNACAQNLPFNIAPTTGTTLPTVLIPGQTTVAYYTVTNTTPITSAITGNFVKYFPPNVSQLLTDTTYSNICQKTFTLQPRGQTGDSCTLKLLVAGPVQTVCTNTNAHECLFICMSDRSTCGGTNYPLKITKAQSVAVGYSINALSEYSPLAYTSTDGGKNWILSSTVIDPIGSTQGSLNGVACTGAKCTTVGYTFTPSFVFFPLSYTSQDTGKTWVESAEVILPQPYPNFDSALFNQVSCYNTTCTAVGNIYLSPFTSPAEPISYTSTNQGENWTLSNQIPAPTPAKAQRDLWGVSCSSNLCAAVGQNNDLFSTAGIPLGYYSTNSGKTWQLSSAFTLPVGQTQGSLLSDSCQGSHCVTVGVSYNTSVGITEFIDALPLVYTSDNNGVTWSSPVGAISAAGGKTYGFLWSVTCNNMTCVAVGQSYDDSSTDSIPTSYLSTDGGAHWTASVTGLDLPAGKSQGLLYTVSCTNAYCIAVGAAYNLLSTDPIPLVYTSPDNGVTWTRSEGLSLPADAVYGGLVGVNSGS